MASGRQIIFADVCARDMVTTWVTKKDSSGYGHGLHEFVVVRGNAVVGSSTRQVISLSSSN